MEHLNMQTRFHEIKYTPNLGLHLQAVLQLKYFQLRNIFNAYNDNLFNIWDSRSSVYEGFFFLGYNAV